LRFEEDEHNVGKVLFIDKEEAFVIAKELAKVGLTTNLRDSFFCVEDANSTFQVAFDDIQSSFWFSFKQQQTLSFSEKTIKETPFHTSLLPFYFAIFC